MLPKLKQSLREINTLVQSAWEWRLGCILIGGFIGARWLGLFTPLELVTLDFFLSHRLPEQQDDHVVIVLADRSVISPREALTDAQVADLLETIFSADPAVVGLNIFRSESSPRAGRDRLVELFKAHSNLVGVEKTLPPRDIPPMAEVPYETAQRQFGMNDVPIDDDSRIRRVFLGAYTSQADSPEASQESFKFSFAFKVAQQYLDAQGYTTDNHPSEPDAPIFVHQDTQKSTVIPILKPTFGAYLLEDDIAKLQTMLNFRAGAHTFKVINAAELDKNPERLAELSGKAVIVGSINYFFPRFLTVSASSNLISQENELPEILPRLGILGAELEAHAASQIINAALSDRPLISRIHPILDNLLIMGAGILGILIANVWSSAVRNTGLLIVTIAAVGASSYVMLCYLGLWLPGLPAALLLTLTGVTYIARYQSDRLTLIESRKLEDERRKAIEQTFNAIHAGPLQTLASLLRNVRDGNTDQAYLLEDLEALNKEIRGIGEQLRQEAIGDVYFVDVRRHTKLDLTHPMHEVFYEVYNLSLQKELPGFKTIKVRSVAFESFDCQQLSLELKRDLCWFLQESLDNVGKHAVGTTRLLVTGKILERLYTLRIEDNGPGLTSTHVGEGTRLFYQLEASFKGKFTRTSKAAGGTICQFTWPLRKL